MPRQEIGKKVYLSHQIVFLPLPLALYIASSACLIISSAFVSSPSYTAIPMLPVHRCLICTSWCFSSVKASEYSSESELRIFSAMPFAITAEFSGFWSKSFNRMTNSSPQKRATVSISRTQFFMRFAASIRRRSPNPCPYLSFSGLKLSRSMNNTAPYDAVRLWFIIDCCKRSMNSLRFGRFVSQSWNAILRTLS